jgi:signal transduction histidine kinase
MLAAKDAYTFVLDEFFCIQECSVQVPMLLRRELAEFVGQKIFSLIQPEISLITIYRQLALQSLFSCQAAYFHVQEQYYQKFVITVFRKPETPNAWFCQLFPADAEEYEEKYLIKQLELQNFIYRISHNLQGPVKTLKGLSNIIRMEQDIDQIRHMIGYIEATTEKLDQLLDRLSQVVEVNAGLLGDSTQIDFESVLYKVLHDLHRRKDISNVFFKINNTLKVPFWSYEHLIATMFQHLVTNAVEAFQGRAGYQVTIDILPYKETSVRVVLANNGPAIPESLERKLFSMFAKGINREGNHGLGLYIVKNIVEILEGQVTYKKTLEGTVTFTICLPNLRTVLHPENGMRYQA